MTSAAAEVNVTYDAIDVTDLDGIFLHRIVRGGPGYVPEVAGRDDPLPGADGMFPRNRRKRRRVIEIQGWVRGVSSSEATDRDDYWTNRAALEALFNVAVDPSDLPDVVLDTGTAVYTIAARTLSVEFNEILPSFAEVSIVLESIAPDWTTGS